MDGRLRNMTSIYIIYEDQILLLYRQGGRVADQMWVASAGGHFEESELHDAGACAMRELEEELGITGDVFHNIELRYITLRRIKGEIRQNYYFFAELPRPLDFELVSNEGILQWFDISKIRTLKMPYTAKYVIENYLDIGAFCHKLYGGIADGERVLFVEMPEYRSS